MTQDDLRAAVVVLHRSVDFNRSPFELAYISDVFEVVRENHNRKWAGVEILTEVEEGDSLAALFDIEDGAANALGRPDVLVRVREGDTIGRSRAGHDERKREHDHAQRS